MNLQFGIFFTEKDVVYIAQKYQIKRFIAYSLHIKIHLS